MKNIHILPTDKPSRLQINKHGTLFLSMEAKSYSDCTNQNIYITSDEEINVGDYVYSIRGFVGKFGAFENSYQNECKKIILTTDQDLIKDDVQAIDDEFLEWFVKNPSCEEVEIEKSTNTADNIDSNIPTIPWTFYKIIIPSEEPKQETLEEVELRQLFRNRSNCYADADDVVQAMDENCFIETINEWQQERSYSEEEVLVMLSEIRKGSMVTSSINNRTYWEFDIKSTKEWFKQFKNK